VNAKDGTEIAAYENMGDLPISVLYGYARLARIPVENILDDDRDLWFGHPQEAPRRRNSRAKDVLAIIGFVVVVWFLGPPLVYAILSFVKELWDTLFSSS
jgi:hypothetical protein